MRFKTFVLAAKADLANLYQQQSGGRDERTRQRDELRAHWQNCYFANIGHLGNGRFNALMGERFNNALLLSLGTYADWVSAFAQLFLEVNQDWPKFYDEVEALTKLSAAHRLEQLQSLHRRGLLQQQNAHRTDHQNSQQVQCQAFADHILD